MTSFVLKGYSKVDKTLILKLKLIIKLCVENRGLYESSRVSISLGNSNSRSRSKAFETLASVSKMPNQKLNSIRLIDFDKKKLQNTQY